MTQELLLPGVRLNAKHFLDKQHWVVSVQLGKGEERVSVSGHISHYAFFIFFGKRVVLGGWRVAFGVWRVVFGVWRVAFCSFARCLVLQLPPPAKRRDGGVAAAGGWEQRQVPRGRRQAAVGRHLAAIPPKAYKVALIHTMLNTTTIMLTSEWLIHRVYKRFRQKV